LSSYWCTDKNRQKSCQKPSNEWSEKAGHTARGYFGSEQLSTQSTPLLVPLHKLPFEAVAKRLKQMPIVQTHHWFAGLDIECDPAALRSRIPHDFNSTH
jgi:hypothetical protein